MTYDQQEFDIRLEWGKRGVAVLAPLSDVVIIVDVLSFTTGVDVAVSRGAVVFPYAGPREGVADYAAAHQAELADHRGRSRYSLSPDTLQTIPPGTRLVLPSPNGSTLTIAAKPRPVLAGCLRNAEAVAAAARQMGQTVAVIAAGERWKDDATFFRTQHYFQRMNHDKLANIGTAGSRIGCFWGVSFPKWCGLSGYITG